MRTSLALLGLVVLAGCRSAVSPVDPRPEPVPAAPIVVATAAVVPTAKDQVEAFLQVARDAVVAGETDEFVACEAATMHALAASDASPARPDGAWVTAVLDELDRLASQLQEDEEGDEPPPEPQPVAPQRVAELEQQAASERFDLPVVVTPEVASLIEFYTGRYRERFTASLERAARYLPYIRQELRQAGMPADLAYLPIVESAFNPRARSRARAQGMWQFMAGTGKIYDLRADGLVDERNDPYLSTRAAVRHLQDLYATFGNWELALAAYNSGAGRVQRALQRSRGATDFWSLRKYLPRETRNYVPAMWAALIVAKAPATYGLPVFADNPLCLDRLPVDGALDLQVLAERAGFALDELTDLNPALTRGITPVKGRYELAVPCGRKEAARAAIAEIPPSERVKRFLHVVRKGDTPAAIARQYGSTVDAILAANNLKSPRSLRIGQTLVVPRAGAPATVARASTPVRHERKPTVVAAATTQAVTGDPAPDRYVVRRGDTLFAIARRFGTSTDELQRLNRLPSSRIAPGDVLVVAR